MIGTPDGAALLEVQNVHSGYGETTVLRDVTLTVRPSSVVAVVGANGAGKSTLLKTISGLLRPTSGNIRLVGHDITDVRTSRRVADGMCLIPEGRGIFRSLTVKENLTLSAPARSTDTVGRVVEAFPDLSSRLRDNAGNLSGGQQQMLALAVAYARNPKLVLVDEASLGLAPIVVDAVFEFLHKLTNAGAALLIVDQFVHRVLQIADAAYVLRRGQIAFSGPADRLLNEDLFAEYMGAGTG